MFIIYISSESISNPLLLKVVFVSAITSFLLREWSSKICNEKKTGAMDRFYAPYMGR